MNGIFSVLQKIGRAFMLPIAVLPMAGILLGVGGAFTSGPLIETYNLTFLASGTLANQFLVLCFQAGLFVFVNLPLLFAVGVAIGMANSNKETAALSAVIGFLLFHTVISSVLGFQGLSPDTTSIDALIMSGAQPDEAVGLASMYTKELGIFTLQTGVFGGITCGLLSAFITNRFSNVALPDYLAFFSGNRLVPVMTMLFFIPLAFLFPFIWPPIFKSIVFAGEAFSSMGYIGTFLYGSLMRLLNVFGLHHAIYPLFWYTELGGVQEVAGQMVAGGQKIFFAQLADPSTVHFSSEATRTMTGGFLPMMFGLPAAALAMYRCADDKNKAKVKGILFSAALTSFLTGITEPLEFTFLFVAPVLYAVHAVLEGLAYMIMHMLDVAVGITFSRGIIDFTFFGLLQGMKKTSYQWILILGPIYSVIYYFVFSFMIRKFNYSTPGRNDAESKLYTRKDYNSKENALIDEIVASLGGKENIVSLDACITRLRITVKDSKLPVSDQEWKSLGAKGVIRSGNGIQLIYGTQAENYKNQIIEKYQL
ncbi:PTS transporter subunit EIIC [Vibrio metschnikovii]|nr:PTS transporter subunit EIIC [Vibrio metschnikovii]EKO3689003.1 PTS transporter subunit EIIC [Vibrio metschnikovii]EKO3781135.1 PTS transporter subunit EIIC [Vibrio metschnikovii]EKO3888121.1 PTS transporter subunit EIIC [Vibrio metschnikovii]EKO3936737.1 PTS transporter subunit EIIC [Vibrio metschnikovii]